MKKYGLIGSPLEHSFSKEYFTQKFENEKIMDCSYDLYPLSDIGEISQLLKNNPELEGLNVTTPYKETIIPYLDELDKTAEKIGAVNVIKIKKGKLIGFNSDAYGFQKSLEHWLDSTGKKVPNITFVLGTGGAAKCVVHVLKSMGCEAYFVSRNKELKCFEYDDLNWYMKTHKSPMLIVNATPVGTFPNIEKKPEISYNYLKNNALAYDLVYNPEETLFLKLAKEKGCETKNGLEMLHLQAEKAWEIWQKK